MTRRTFAARAARFYAGLRAPRVPRGVRVMNPYRDARVMGYVRAFLDRYFADERQRTLVFGINPGRFGAGVTGVTFTDPVALADVCGIPNHLTRRRELSSIFIYQVIGELGGPAAFFRRYFLTATSPLGFLRGRVNLNYYDEPRLSRDVTPFIVSSIRRQLAIGGRRDGAVVLGTGENARFLEALNEQHGFFRRLAVLEHPRFIMQYRHSHLSTFVEKYAATLNRAVL